ncbi:MAG: MazG nucleotide pyrophosphohydrolase domain-containing protein [Candidatus Woesearchaeota archaeon]
MIHDINLVKSFHEKFEVPVLSKPSLISADRAKLRFNLMQEEVKEYLDGVENRDMENIAKELADILYVVYGTILEHGLQDKMDEIFEEVHRSNMSKSYHKYKMVKGEGYVQANLSSFFKE